MSTISGYYQEDHDRLDALFLSFLKNQHEMIFEQAKNNFEEFQKGLLKHIVWEEEILFPFFESKTNMHDAGPTAVMRFEHKQIKDLLGKIWNKVSALQAANPQDEEAIKHILNMHNMKGENVLYPMIDKLSSEDEKNTIFQKMNASQSSTCCA